MGHLSKNVDFVCAYQRNEYVVSWKEKEILCHVTVFDERLEIGADHPVVGG